MRSEAVLAEITVTPKKSTKKKRAGTAASRGGSGSREIEKLKKISGLKDEVIAACMDISVKTYRSYRDGITRMKNATKERVQMLTDVFAHGVDIFGSSEKFAQWLETENFFFDRKPPMNYLHNIKGIDYVESRLTAMEYGDNV